MERARLQTKLNAAELSIKELTKQRALEEDDSLPFLVVHDTSTVGASQQQHEPSRALSELSTAFKFATKLRSQLKNAAPLLISMEESVSELKRSLESATERNQALDIHLRGLANLREALEKAVEESDTRCTEILGQTLTVETSESEIQQCSRNISSLMKKLLVIKPCNNADQQGRELPSKDINKLITLKPWLNVKTLEHSPPSSSAAEPFTTLLREITETSLTFLTQGGCLKFDNCNNVSEQHTVLHKECRSQATLGQELHKEIEDLLATCQGLNEAYKRKYMVMRGLEGDEQFMSHPDVWSQLSELLPRSLQSLMDVTLSKCSSSSTITQQSQPLPPSTATKTQQPGCTQGSGIFTTTATTTGEPTSNQVTNNTGLMSSTISIECIVATKLRSQLKNAAPLLVSLEESVSSLKQSLESATERNQELAVHLSELANLREALDKAVEESETRCKEILGQTLTVESMRRFSHICASVPLAHFRSREKSSSKTQSAPRRTSRQIPFLYSTSGNLNTAFKVATKLRSQLKNAAPLLVSLEESVSSLKKSLESATETNQALAVHLSELANLREALEKAVEESETRCKEILGQKLTVESSESEIRQCSRNISLLMQKLLGIKPSSSSINEEQRGTIPVQDINKLMTLKPWLQLQTLLEQYPPSSSSSLEPLSLLVREITHTFDSCSKVIEQHTLFQKECDSQFTLCQGLHDEIGELFAACQGLNEGYSRKYMVMRGLEGDESFMSHPDVWHQLSELLPRAQQVVMDITLAKFTSGKVPPGSQQQAGCTASGSASIPPRSTTETATNSSIHPQPQKQGGINITTLIASCAMRGHATSCSIHVATLSAVLRKHI
ncbi:hypothetical protein Pelo_9650 [Pelomyxa schiedti]|nr:hypothetical protein Pelo_9650 [Pelomyxa schiedti]